jgi:hypothetical protein
VKKTLYLNSSIASFENGAITDLRFRATTQLMAQHGPCTITESIPGGSQVHRLQTPEEYAEYWIRAGEVLVDKSAELGYVVDMPEDDGLDRNFRLHLRRQTRAGMYQQACAQSIASDEAQPQVERATRIPQKPNSGN